MNTTTENNPTPIWAVIELMGHVRYGGKVSKDTQFGTALLRIEVPKGDGFVTQLVNPSSLYRLTITTEELARLAAKSGQMEPMNAWEIERAKSLPVPGDRPNDDDDRADDDQGHDDDDDAF